jgi:ABC-type dipeptide/oligopeptide/nickel transport system permease component
MIRVGLRIGLRLVLRLVLRLGGAVGVLAVLAALIVTLGRLMPGDPVASLAAQPGLGAGELAQMRADLALDAPVWAQAQAWLAGLAEGDLGQSLVTGRPVAQDVALRLAASVELAAAGLGVALVLALPLALVAALRPDGLADRVVRALAAFWGAVPTFLSGLVLIEVFYARLGIAPQPVGRVAALGPPPPPVRTGMMTLDAALVGDGAALVAALAQMALPAVCMGLFAFGPILRIARASLRAALASPALEAARVLGVPAGQAVRAHALRAAAGPVIAVAGLSYCYLLGAATVVEKVFAWPGVGLYALEAALARDQAPVLGALMAVGCVVVAVQLLAEALQAWADPRRVDAH